MIFIVILDNNDKVKQIEKEISKIKSNYTQLNWNNIKTDFEYIANKYKYLLKKEQIIAEDSPIWIMWYQGIENAPPIVKACIQSVMINRAKHPVYIISKYNLEKYIYLPYHIKEKFNNKTFSVTHFSDILRFALLSRYGGYWIDSTFFLTTPLIKLNTTFFTLKLKYCWIQGHPFIKCLFSGNFIAVSKNSFIAIYCYIAFLLYWKKYNSLIDYQLIDYIIYIAYIKIKEFTEKINALPFIECNIFLLAENFNSNYNKSYFLCSYNKLSYKRAVQSSNNNSMTNYGYLIKNYEKDVKHIDKKF